MVADDVDVGIVEKGFPIGAARLHNEMVRIHGLDLCCHFRTPGQNVRRPVVVIQFSIAGKAAEFIAQLPGQNGGIVLVNNAVHRIFSVQESPENGENPP